MYWNQWPLERVLVLFTALAFILVDIQVTMSHYRQNFHHKAMYIPVVSLPLFSVAGLVLAFYRAAWVESLFTLLMVVGIVAGGYGGYLHLHGVGVRVGGYEGRNFLMGPPVILPLLISALCALGLFALYWG